MHLTFKYAWEGIFASNKGHFCWSEIFKNFHRIKQQKWNLEKCLHINRNSKEKLRNNCQKLCSEKVHFRIFPVPNSNHLEYENIWQGTYTIAAKSMPNIIERTQNEEPERSEKLECDTLSQRVYLFHHYKRNNLSELVKYAERKWRKSRVENIRIRAMCKCVYVCGMCVRYRQIIYTEPMVDHIEVSYSYTFQPLMFFVMF